MLRELSENITKLNAAPDCENELGEIWKNLTHLYAEVQTRENWQDSQLRSLVNRLTSIEEIMNEEFTSPVYFTAFSFRVLELQKTQNMEFERTKEILQLIAKDEKKPC